MTIRIRIAALAGAIALACSAGAQQAPDQDQSHQPGTFDNVVADSSSRVVDPPTRVARLADLSGDVSFAPAGESDWSRAQRNRPMVTGDKLYTNTDGRAELQVGAATIHVDQHTSMDFLNLNDQTAQVELTQGALNLNVRRLRSGEVYEVDTPTIAFVADRIGDYRIDVDPNGQATTVSIRRGSGEAIGEGGKRVRIEESQSIVFNDSQLNDYHNLAQQRRSDTLDTYATQRDQHYDRGVSRNYVSEDVVGYEDLDDNGSWEDAPDYGHVWYPRSVAADWAPYHDGNWDWVEPYGWTWVDNASWGFAPFHYGRWAYIGSRWGWVPGPLDVRPVYAPALVAFVGGGGFGIDVSIGGPIGWFALGPGDVYFPGYRCGRNYFNSVNISNTVVSYTRINNYYGAFSAGNVNYARINYANRMAPRAMTAVSATAFASGRPVAASAIAVNRGMLANARVLPRATVAPTAASLVANRGRAMAPPATVRNRTVVAVNRPAAEATSFAQRQALLRQNPGQPLTTAQMRTVAARDSGRGPAATRANVRIAGATAPMVPARANARVTTGAASTSTRRFAPRTTTAADARNASNTQLRSSGFAHQGNVSTAPRTTANAHAQGTINTHDNAASNRSAATTTQTHTQLSSSRFAQQTHGATAEQHRSAAVTATPRSESTTHARGNVTMPATAHERGSTYAAQNRSNVQTLQAARTQYHAPQSTARVNERAQEQYRSPPLQAHEQSRVQAQQYRAPQTARVTERQHAQYRAPQSQPVARVNEQARAQAQYHEPARPSGQRDQAPQQRQAKRKDEKRDQNGGGGG